MIIENSEISYSPPRLGQVSVNDISENMWRFRRLVGGWSLPRIQQTLHVSRCGGWIWTADLRVM